MEENVIFDLIKNFEKQFDYKPKIENSKNLKSYKKIFVAGMGGSHLAADLIKSIYPKINLTIHSNYGLPLGVDKDSLLIVSSFSGNTEEVIDALNCAIKKKIPTITISSGGKIIDLSKKNSLPFIQLPDNSLPPRLAMGYSLVAFLKILNKKINIEIDNSKIEKEGKKIAEKVYNTIPLIYSSEKNKAIANIWKINFNENAKNPSFINVFPELNHNEMVGFLKNNNQFSFIFIEDENDHPRIKLRMNIFKKIYNKFNIETIKSEEKDIWNKTIYLVLLSIWTSYYLALKNNVEPGKVEVIENFKKELSL